MRTGESTRVYSQFDRRIDALKKQIEEIEHERDVAMAALEKQCVAEHGGHQDDGSMFHGFCTRCGACLG